MWLADEVKEVVEPLKVCDRGGWTSILTLYCFTGLGAVSLLSPMTNDVRLTEFQDHRSSRKLNKMG